MCAAAAQSAHGARYKFQTVYLCINSLSLSLPSAIHTLRCVQDHESFYGAPLALGSLLSGNFSGTKKTEEIMVARGSMLELLRIDPETDKLVGKFEYLVAYLGCT